MSTDTNITTVSNAALEELVRRARSLYSLPAVAANVIELTRSPRTDAQALNDCIHTDPALASKVLRVVNSSLFGMSRKVCSLNQAIALLGTKPLRLLVLGFSLPGELFCEVAREQLDWYWSTTLSRAVAARVISEQLFTCPGDEAFLAGLLQDIGILVLLGELQEPYADVLSLVIGQRLDLQRLEMDSLGFSHRTLSARLLEHWNMPALLVDAIAETADVRSLADKKSPTGEMARILHLAALTGELVGHNHLSVLPELMEAGKVYCELDERQLNDIVTVLQPSVQQLAELLSLDLPRGRDYGTILAEAYRQMSELSESVAGLLVEQEETQHDVLDELAGNVAHLQSTVERVLYGSGQETERVKRCDGSVAPVARELSGTASGESMSSRAGIAETGTTFADRLAVSVRQCRSLRLPISLLLVEASGGQDGDDRGLQILDHVLSEIRGEDNGAAVEVEPITSRCKAVLLPGWERQQAVRLAEDVFHRVEGAISRVNHTGPPLNDSVCAGIASVTLPSKSFVPQELIATASRCLAAAESHREATVKSLEIF